MSAGTFYNTFSFLYPVVDIFLHGHKKLVAKHVNALRGTKLLEVGAGSGSHLKLYRNKKVTAIDVSEKMLALARNRNPNANFIVMDGEEVKFSDKSFDCVVMCHVLAVTPNPDRMLYEAYRVLRPGGHLVILNHFTPDNFLGPADRAFSPVAKLLSFRSYFPLSRLDLSKFVKVEEIACGAFSYFKILILQKP